MAVSEDYTKLTIQNRQALIIRQKTGKKAKNIKHSADVAFDETVKTA